MIALANMPFMLLNNPELAPALISALLKNSGMEVTSFYFNADFARDIGYERYMELSKYGVHIQAGVCEWLFAGSAWGWDAARENEALEKLISLKNSRFGPSSMEWLDRKSVV